MEYLEAWDLLSPLWADVREEDEYQNKKPLLAHYTSLQILEQIIKTNEIWLSNPLFMNDFEEVRFGFIHGVRIVRDSEDIKRSLGTEERYSKFLHSLTYYLNDFEKKHLLDTYVFCFSELPKDNSDGLLSMWRGYGGNGKGAAFVIDTANLTPMDNAPLILSEVKYASVEQRLDWIKDNARKCADIISQTGVDDDSIHWFAHILLERIKLFALYTKHRGFDEEREWRLLYLSERDAGKKLASGFHYFNGPRGMEPKLRFKLEAQEGLTTEDFSIDKALHSILLGPSISSPLAKESVCRMLDLIKRPELKDRVHASSIPFRSS